MQRSAERTTYLVLCVLGAVIPYTFFIAWLLDHGLDIGLFVDALFANRVSTFFVVDVLLSACTLLVVVHVNRERLTARQRAAVVAGTCLVGVSFGLPLFLWIRAGEPTSLSSS